MQLKWFRIPVSGCPETEEALNAFLRGNRVLSVTRELVERDTAPGWAVCVEYQDAAVGAGTMRRGDNGRAAKKIDYREVLTEGDFAVFSKLRDLRKSLAESEGVPVYAIFTNEQLADVAKARPPSKAALGKINGIGEGRLPKDGRIPPASFQDAESWWWEFPGFETPGFVPWPFQGRNALALAGP